MNPWDTYNLIKDIKKIEDELDTIQYALNNAWGDVHGMMLTIGSIGDDKKDSGEC